jgi:hypothetical protein
VGPAGVGVVDCAYVAAADPAIKDNAAASQDNL